MEGSPGSPWEWPQAEGAILARSYSYWSIKYYFQILN